MRDSRQIRGAGSAHFDEQCALLQRDATCCNHKRFSNLLIPLTPGSGSSPVRSASYFLAEHSVEAGVSPAAPEAAGAHRRVITPPCPAPRMAPALAQQAAL